MATKTEKKTYTLELTEGEYAWVVAGLLSQWEARHVSKGAEKYFEEIEDLLTDLGEMGVRGAM